MTAKTCSHHRRRHYRFSRRLLYGKEIKEKNLPLELTLVEASPRVGGKIQTVKKDGYIIERGPDSFLERKKSAPQLVKDLGLEHLLVNNATGQSYVLVNRTLHPMPKGAVMGIPTKLRRLFLRVCFPCPGRRELLWISSCLQAKQRMISHWENSSADVSEMKWSRT